MRYAILPPNPPSSHPHPPKPNHACITSLKPASPEQPSNARRTAAYTTHHTSAILTFVFLPHQTHASIPTILPCLPSHRLRRTRDGAPCERGARAQPPVLAAQVRTYIVIGVRARVTDRLRGTPSANHMVRHGSESLCGTLLRVHVWDSWRMHVVSGRVYVAESALLVLH